jgi:hypothetical protein
MASGATTTPTATPASLVRRYTAAGIARIMLFNERLKTKRVRFVEVAYELTGQSGELAYWNQFVNEFFTPAANFKLNLWNDELQENRCFSAFKSWRFQGANTADILQPNIARFFALYHSIDLDEMTLHLVRILFFYFCC